MRHRDQRMQQLVPSVDAVCYDLRLASVKYKCVFLLLSVFISYDMIAEPSHIIYLPQNV